MPIYQARMSYLLKLDFRGTVKVWKNNPEQLDRDIKKFLNESSQYIKELEAKGMPINERVKYVQMLLAPTDVSKMEKPDEELYSKIMEWAFERECRFMEDQRRQKS